MKILSIDTWGNRTDGYDWNQWCTVGEISKEELASLDTDKKIATWFYDNGFTTTADMRRIVIDDDGYNITIADKKDRRPLFAIEYGPEV